MNRTVLIILFCIALLAGLLNPIRTLVQEKDEALHELSQAKAIIEEQQKQLEANAKVYTFLNEEIEKLKEERNDLNNKMSDILSKEENREWGATRVPEDIQKFLMEMKCDR